MPAYPCGNSRHWTCPLMLCSPWGWPLPPCSLPAKGQAHHYCVCSVPINIRMVKWVCFIVLPPNGLSLWVAKARGTKLTNVFQSLLSRSRRPFCCYGNTSQRRSPSVGRPAPFSPCVGRVLGGSLLPPTPHRSLGSPICQLLSHPC